MRAEPKVDWPNVALAASRYKAQPHRLDCFMAGATRKTGRRARDPLGHDVIVGRRGIASYLLQCTADIGDEVALAFEPGGNPHQRVTDPQRGALLGLQL